MQLNQQVVYQLAEAAIKLRKKDSKVEELQEEVDELRKAKLAAEDQLMLQQQEGKAAEVGGLHVMACTAVTAPQQPSCNLLYCKHNTLYLCTLPNAVIAKYGPAVNVTV